MHFEIKTDTDYNFLKSRESRFKSITVTFSDRLPFEHAYLLQPYHLVHMDSPKNWPIYGRSLISIKTQTVAGEK